MKFIDFITSRLLLIFPKISGNIKFPCVWQDMLKPVDYIIEVHHRSRQPVYSQRSRVMTMSAMSDHTGGENVSCKDWLNEWVVLTLHLRYIMAGHFADESFQAIHCTGTDNQKQWYASYNLRPGNGTDPILNLKARTRCNLHGRVHTNNNNTTKDSVYGDKPYHATWFIL